MGLREACAFAVLAAGCAAAAPAAPPAAAEPGERDRELPPEVRLVVAEGSKRTVVVRVNPR